MKEKKPGDHIILRLKNTESPVILDWINRQSNLSDAIRYLIEEEIRDHNLRDLQEAIPAKRKPVADAIEQVEANEAQAAGSPLQKDIAVRAEAENALAFENDTDDETEQGAASKADAESDPAKENDEEDDEEYSEDLIDAWMNI